jgi:hypothetical protein
MAKFARGSYGCSTNGCDEQPVVSVMLYAITPGGRKERKQTNSGTHRLCEDCAKRLATGKLSKELTEAVSNAIREVGIEVKR